MFMRRKSQAASKTVNEKALVWQLKSVALFLNHYKMNGGFESTISRPLFVLSFQK